MTKQIGRITYIATQDTLAGSPYDAAMFYALAQPWHDFIDAGEEVEVGLTNGYKQLNPSYDDDRTMTQSSSGVVEVRHFATHDRFKLQIPEVVESHNVDYVKNGFFGSTMMWNDPDGCTVGNGSATWDGSQSATSILTNTGTVPLGDVVVKYTINGRTAGAIQPSIGGTLGTSRTANGTFEETITPSAAGAISLNADASFDGAITNVSVKAKSVASQFALFNALSDELAKGTLIRWWPDFENRQGDYFECIATKRNAPRRRFPFYRWTFTFDLTVAPTVQFPSTIPPFVEN